MMMQQVERYRHKFVVQRRRLIRANHRLRLSTRSNVLPARASVPAPAPLANMASAVVVKFDLGALPSSEKKTRMTSHQVQLERENKEKRASVNDLSTSRATTLLSDERKKPKCSDRPSRR
jgi:hypothetical protein